MLDKLFAQHPTIFKYDRFGIGIVVGLVVPIFGVVVVYLLSIANHFITGDAVVTIPQLIAHIDSLVLLSKFLSVGCILNLGAFFLFINRDYYNISRGIIFATMLVALPIIFETIRNWFA